MALHNLVGALLEELADEVPDDPRLETVRADLLAAANSYEAGDKKDLAMRFYLATRSLLRENMLLQERVRPAEPARMSQPSEYGYRENVPHHESPAESVSNTSA